MIGSSASVIMPAYNASTTLAAALDGLAEQDAEFPWELIVVDNNSTDDTVAIAESYADRLPIRVVAESVQGINAARNKGISVATSDTIMFADADDVVKPGYVRAMAEAIEKGTIVGGWVERWHLPPEPERQIDPEPITGILESEWLSYPIGCASGFDREVIERIGGFDPNLIYGGDDVDTYWRAQLDGAEMVQAGPDAAVIRRERADPAKLRAQAATFGRAEPLLARRYKHLGHPGRGLRLAPRRAARWWVTSLFAKDLDKLEARRRAAFHGTAAWKELRILLRLDPKPEPAVVRLGSSAD